MSKSLVEKYEQMLGQDPTSTVFVELARAYLDKGENEKAITVCQQGCTHHPNSIVGRVLWGKALINAGKAADAMKQFDLATGIEKENPHAYNLISEVLLRKGLYRSALPILRKAAQLQPNDGRITQWLEQTRAALSGGPAPVLYDSTSVDVKALEAPATPAEPAAAAPAPQTAATPVLGVQPAAPVASLEDENPTSPGVRPTPLPTAAPTHAPIPELSEPSRSHADPDVFAAFSGAKADPTSEATVIVGAYMPETATAEMPATNAPLPWPSAPTSAPPVATDELPLLGAALDDDNRPATEPAVVPGRASPTAELPPAPDPFAALTAGRTESGDTFRGLTSTFQALEGGSGQPLPEPAVVVADMGAPAPVPNRAAGGLLDEVVSAQSEIPTGSYPMPAEPSAPSAAPSSSGAGGLLDEIPSLEAVAPPDEPRHDGDHQHAEAAAKAYEHELRAKLEAKVRQKTFLQKHGAKVAAIAAIAVIGGGGGSAFLFTRYKNQGQNLGSALAKGIAAVNADTKEQYVAGLQVLDTAVKMDDGSVDGWTYNAYANAMLAAEHGGNEGNKNAALTAISKPNVRAVHPGYAAVVDFLTADPANLTAARQQLLSSTLDASTEDSMKLDASAVCAQKGKLLLADKKLDDAFKLLSRAVELNTANVRALVLLGEYYLAFEDFEGATKVFGGAAEQLSKYHPARVMGMAEARLELGREQAEALSDLEGLPSNAAISDALKGRYALLLGRAQSANSKHDDALKTLTDGLAAYKNLAFDFQLAIGQALRTAGQMDRAQKAYDDALKLQPKSETAKEGLGRVLLARSRERELLERIKPDGDGKRVPLVRGIAYTRLGEFRNARAELAKTATGTKYPAEAVVYLSIADAQEDSSDKPIAALEKIAATNKRSKATVQVALARIYMQKNMLDKARAQLEEASKDPQDFEGNALLGELLLNAGVPADMALDPLQRAVDRNGSHAPARHFLTRTLLALGRGADAQKQLDAWTTDNPSSDLAWKDAALVALRTGRIKEAETAILKAVRNDSNDAEGWRLRAQILFAKGDQDGGLQALQRANKLSLTDAETFCEIGNLFMRGGKFDDTKGAYAKAHEVDPKAYCAIIGPFHVNPGAPGGKAALNSLLKLPPTAWEKGYAQATLARVLLEERDVKGAAAMANEATQTAPGLGPAWFALGEVSRRQKNEAKALEAYAKAVELEASWSGAHLAYADALAASRGGPESLRKALGQYELFLKQSGNERDVARVKKLVVSLKKQLK